MKRVVVLFLSCLFVLFCGCNRKGATAESVVTRTNVVTEVDSLQETTATDVNREKQKIVEMFMKYGTYYSDGVYRFNNQTVKDDVVFGYTFSYSPESDSFVCSCMVTTFARSLSSVLSDYGSVVFYWGNLENGYFSGDHRLEDESSKKVLATIEFEYSATNLNANVYKIKNNTYSQLSQSEIKEYANTSFECMKQGLQYANSIISAYTDNITLW